jgi:hypothetical protein
VLCNLARRYGFNEIYVSIALYTLTLHENHHRVLVILCISSMCACLCVWDKDIVPLFFR